MFNKKSKNKQLIAGKWATVHCGTRLENKADQAPFLVEVLREEAKH